MFINTFRLVGTTIAGKKLANFFNQLLTECYDRKDISDMIKSTIESHLFSNLTKNKIDFDVLEIGVGLKLIVAGSPGH